MQVLGCDWTVTEWGRGLVDCYIELCSFIHSNSNLALVTCYMVTVLWLFLIVFVVSCNSLFSSGDFSLILQCFHSQDQLSHFLWACLLLASSTETLSSPGCIMGVWYTVCTVCFSFPCLLFWGNMFEPDTRTFEFKSLEETQSFSHFHLLTEGGSRLFFFWYVGFGDFFTDLSETFWQCYFSM